MKGIILMGATETIRIRLEPKLKEDLQEYCARRGTTISQEIRDYLKNRLLKQESALDRFDVLLARSEQKLEASGLSAPTMDELNLYIESVRKERIGDLGKAS
jgi:antitoxin component of RelBE/YafQ-DinJ toxin-antitoxin module